MNSNLINNNHNIHNNNNNTYSLYRISMLIKNKFKRVRDKLKILQAFCQNFKNISKKNLKFQTIVTIKKFIMEEILNNQVKKTK